MYLPNFVGNIFGLFIYLIDYLVRCTPSRKDQVSQRVMKPFGNFLTSVDFFADIDVSSWNGNGKKES